MVSTVVEPSGNIEPDDGTDEQAKDAVVIERKSENHHQVPVCMIWTILHQKQHRVNTKFKAQKGRI